MRLQAMMCDHPQTEMREADLTALTAEAAGKLDVLGLCEIVSKVQRSEAGE